MAASSPKILVINLTRMGDILQSIPLLQALKRKYLGAQIHFLAVESYAEICSLIPEIDLLVPFNFGSAVAASKDAIGNLPRRLQEVETFVSSLEQEKYDIVINLSHSRISALLCKLLGAKDTRGLTLDRAGFRQILHPWARYFFTANLNRAYNRFNLVDIHLGLAAGGTDSAAQIGSLWNCQQSSAQNLRLTPEAKKKADLLLQPKGEKALFKIGFQPGASLANKRWPAGHFVELGRLLQSQFPVQMLIFGSKAETGLAHRVAEPLGPAALNLAGKTEISTLAAVLSRLDLLITNDTGTQHLAAAVGTPVISLCLGSALSHETGPYGRNHLVIEPTISCFPCSFQVQCSRFRCHEQVLPEAVFQIARKMLEHDAVYDDEAQFAQLNLWRTDFDAEGFWLQRPAIRRPLTPDHFINMVIRVIWKDVLLGVSQRQAAFRATDFAEYMRDYLPPDQPLFASQIQDCICAYNSLGQLSESGLTLCQELAGISAPPISEYARIQAIANELAELDRRLSQIGQSHPPVKHLVLDFTFGKQNLEEAEIHVLARQTGALYQRLATSAERFVQILSSAHEDIFDLIPAAQPAIPQNSFAAIEG